MTLSGQSSTSPHETTDGIVSFDHSEDELEWKDFSQKEVCAGWRIKLPPPSDSDPDDSRHSSNASDTEYEPLKSHNGHPCSQPKGASHCFSESSDQGDGRKASDNDERTSSSQETDRDTASESDATVKLVQDQGKSTRCGGAGTGGSCLEEEGDLEEETQWCSDPSGPSQKFVPPPRHQILHEAQRAANHASLVASRWAPSAAASSSWSRVTPTTSTAIQTSNADSELSKLLAELGTPLEVREVESLPVEHDTPLACSCCKATVKAEVIQAEFASLKAELLAERRGREDANLLYEAAAASVEHEQERIRRSLKEAEAVSRSAQDTRRVLEEAASRSAEEAQTVQARLSSELHAETAARNREMAELHCTRKVMKQRRKTIEMEQAEDKRQRGQMLTELALEKRRRVEVEAQRKDLANQQLGVAEDLRSRLAQAERTRDDALERVRNAQRETRSAKAALAKFTSELSQEVEARATVEREFAALKKQWAERERKHEAFIEEWAERERSNAVREEHGERVLALLKDGAADRPSFHDGKMVKGWSPLSMTCCQGEVFNPAAPESSPASQAGSRLQSRTSLEVGVNEGAVGRGVSDHRSHKGLGLARREGSVDSRDGQNGASSTQKRNAFPASIASPLSESASHDPMAMVSVLSPAGSPVSAKEAMPAAIPVSEAAPWKDSAEVGQFSKPSPATTATQLMDAIERMKLRRESERQELKTCQARASSLQKLFP